MRLRKTAPGADNTQPALLVRFKAKKRRRNQEGRRRLVVLVGYLGLDQHWSALRVRHRKLRTSRTFRADDAGGPERNAEGVRVRRWLHFRRCCREALSKQCRCQQGCGSE